MFDREMRYLAVSRRFAADYRTSVQDLMGRSHYDVFPEIPERWRRIHERCLAGAIERCDEDPFPRADGTLDWIQWEICPWRTAAGEVGGIILFSEVITGRKRAEEALREREREIERQARELHAVLDTVPAAIYISRDAAGSRIEGNRYGQELLRVPAGDNVSRSAPEHERPTYRVLRNGVEVPPEELPVQVASTRGRSVKDWECTIAFEDGTSVELLGYATPLALGGGGAVAAFVDITARKRAEVALRSQEAWYRALFDSTQQGLFVLEALRDGAGAVVDWIHRDVNPAGLRILRLERAQVVGKPVSQLVPERVAEWLPGWRRVLESGESWSYETSFGGIAFLVTAFRMDRDTLGTAAVDLSRTLRKLLPLCAWCGRIRNDAGDFEQLEQYLRDHTEATFSHGLCPECARRHFANVLE
jgi:PAS domain S-box-containing protein